MGLTSLCASVFGGRTRTLPATGFDVPPPPPITPGGRSNDEHLVGRGGLAAACNVLLADFAPPGPGLRGGSKALMLLVVVEGKAVSVTGVTGLAGCDKLCSGAWNVYTVNGGLWWPFSYATKTTAEFCSLEGSNKSIKFVNFFLIFKNKNTTRPRRTACVMKIMTSKQFFNVF